jgi:hypothetical protein
MPQQVITHVSVKLGGIFKLLAIADRQTDRQVSSVLDETLSMH